MNILLKLCTILLVYISSGLAPYDFTVSISLYTDHLKMTQAFFIHLFKFIISCHIYVFYDYVDIPFKRVMEI